MRPVTFTRLGPLALGIMPVLHANFVTGPNTLGVLKIIISMPLPFKLLVTHTFNEMLEEVAAKDINELFSITPQKALVRSGQVSGAKETDVVPQNPLRLQILGAVSHVLPAD